MRRFLLLLIVIVSLEIAPSNAQDIAINSELMRLLHYVPDLPDYNSVVGFGDVQAWKQSWNMPAINNYEDVEKLDKYQRAYWLNILSRQTFPPPIFTYSQNGSIQQQVGFDLHNINQFITAGSQDGFVVAEHASSDIEISKVLQSTGYSSQTIDAGELYSFGNRLAGFNNILLMVANRVLITQDLDVIGLVSAAQKSKIRPLSENLDYLAAVSALESRQFSNLGTLTGILFLDGKKLSDYGPYLAIKPGTLPSQYQQEIDRLSREMSPLPPYDLVVLATLHGSGFSYQIVMLVLPTGVNANPVAKSLELRLQRYKSQWSPKNYMMDYGLESIGALGLESQGKSIATVIMRVPDPALEFPAGTLNPPNSVPTRVPSWYDILTKSEFSFLAVIGSDSGTSA